MKFVLLFTIFTLASIEGFTINCSYVNFLWPSLGLTYTCMVHPSLSATNPNQVVTGVRGVHLPGRSNADVRMVNFHDVDNLVMVPRGMSNFFPNINAIRIHDSDVRNINGNELNEYRNLRWFSLFDSDVSRIPSNFFAFNPNMNYVAFDANYVRQVGEALFDPILNVRSMNYIGFLSNICIHQAASTPAQIDRILESLRVNCSESSGNTSTQLTTTSRFRSSTSGSSSSSSPVFTTSRSSSISSTSSDGSSSSSPIFTTSSRSSSSSSTTSRSFSRAQTESF